MRYPVSVVGRVTSDSDRLVMPGPFPLVTTVLVQVQLEVVLDPYCESNKRQSLHHCTIHDTTDNDGPFEVPRGGGTMGRDQLTFFLLDPGACLALSAKRSLIWCSNACFSALTFPNSDIALFTSVANTFLNSSIWTIGSYQH